jgi:hypothetical protein
LPCTTPSGAHRPLCLPATRRYWSAAPGSDTAADTPPQWSQADIP